MKYIQVLTHITRTLKKFLIYTAILYAIYSLYNYSNSEINKYLQNYLLTENMRILENINIVLTKKEFSKTEIEQIKSILILQHENLEECHSTINLTKANLRDYELLRDPQVSQILNTK